MGGSIRSQMDKKQLAFARSSLILANNFIAAYQSVGTRKSLDVNVYTLLKGILVMSELFTCPKCKEKNNMLEPACWRCVRPFTESEKYDFFVQAKKSEERKELIASLTPEQQYIENIKLAKETTDWSEVSEEDIEKESNKIILTTSFVVAQQDIKHEVDVITAEVVYGMNIFKDLFSSVRDIVGGRSNATQNVLRDARKVVMRELRKEALLIGADAVISIDLDYQELSGGGKNGMLMVVASGTAVTLVS